MLGLEVSNLKDSHQQRGETVDSGKSGQLELQVTEQAGFKIFSSFRRVLSHTHLRLQLEQVTT
jgi:hypothetical protein